MKEIITDDEAAFEAEIETTLRSLRTLLIEKGKEYRRNNNPFHNFERGAELSGRSPEEVLQGFLLKHLISAEDIRNDSKMGVFPKIEKIHEKYNDILVYFLIEKAMIMKKLAEYNINLYNAKK